MFKSIGRFIIVLLDQSVTTTLYIYFFLMYIYIYNEKFCVGANTNIVN